jgi:cytochrome c
MHGLEFNKIFAALLTAGLVASMASFISREVVHPHMPHESAIEIEGVEAHGSGEPAAPAGPEPVLGLLASADAAAGQASARACTACHSFEQGGPNKVGPNLYNIVNAHQAHLDSFSYSASLAGLGGEWSYEELNKFLFKPKDYVPGTKMNFIGLKDPQDRANIIAYLRSLSGSPAPLPDDARIEAEKAALGFADEGEEHAEAAGGDEPAAAGEVSNHGAAPAEGGAENPVEEELPNGPQHD